MDDNAKNNEFDEKQSDEGLKDKSQAQGETPPLPTPSPDSVVLERARGLWKEIEPQDLSDPVPHREEFYKLNFLNGTRVVAASRRGKSHAHDGKYREDSFCVEHAGEWTFISVADGTGSKPLARVGSRIASSSSVDYLLNQLKNISYGDLESLETSLRSALAGAMVAALASITAEAARRKCDINSFSTTLLLVSYIPLNDELTIVGVAQVGDGGIAIKGKDGEVFTLGVADHGVYGGESLFLTSQETQLSWTKRVFIYQVHKPFKYLVVATDGVFDDFSQPYGELARLFQEIEQINFETHPEEWLAGWLNYERRGSFDDRTLVILIPKGLELQV